jgi:hypothetical protein
MLEMASVVKLDVGGMHGLETTWVKEGKKAHWVW